MTRYKRPPSAIEETTMRLWHGLGRGALVALFALAALAGVRAETGPEARMKRDITFLASDECEGRGPGTRGIDKAADYIANQFKLAGLKPGGPGGSYFQLFPITGPGKLEAAGLTLRGPLGQSVGLKREQDFTVVGFSGSGKVTAPVVFAGFGITAPGVGYDDYKGVDVAGKVVLLLRRAPRYANDKVPFDGDARDRHASLDNKIANAEVHKAAAVLLVNDGTDLARGDKLVPFGLTAAVATPGSIPYLHVRRDLADAMLFSALGQHLGDVEQAIDRDLVPRSAALPGWTVELQTKVLRKTIPVKNVVGVLEGAGPLADETVVVGAHYDHLGYGDPGSRLKKQDRGKKLIHHGADDNASGTTAIMELARHFGKLKGRQGRRLVFIAFSGEERGLLGSRYYCNKEPLFPLAGTAAMFNLDMVGRLRADAKTNKDKLLAEGVGTAKGFAELLHAVNKKFDFRLSEKKGGTGPSDHDSFYRQKVPVLFFWTGYHADYHLPSDTSDKINVAGMKRVVDISEEVVARLAGLASRPEYVRVASDFQPSPSKGMPRLGVMPSYEDEGDVPGLLIDGVSDGGPAAKAGLKTGDRIVEIGGRPVTNINTYMVLMSQQRRGQSVEVRVLRGGKRQAFMVTPQ
jgi:hypothetical protein